MKNTNCVREKGERTYLSALVLVGFLDIDDVAVVAVLDGSVIERPQLIGALGGRRNSVRLVAIRGGAGGRRMLLLLRGIAALLRREALLRRIALLRGIGLLRRVGLLGRVALLRRIALLRGEALLRRIALLRRVAALLRGIASLLRRIALWGLLRGIAAL